MTAFENEADLGLKGNFGTNEYLNFGMPLWNAFGLGWQIGARGTQTGFGSRTLAGKVIDSRNQQFVTTGLFTRAFEGRGFQGGTAFDYLNNTGFAGTTDVKQMRGEVSYVWGYHELGFWGAFNAGKGLGIQDFQTKQPFVNNTVHTYNAFYRVQFGDANEWKVWGGASHEGQGYVGSILRAPMTRSLALEGTFAYLMPGKSKTATVTIPGVAPAFKSTFTPMAWNLGINLVYYPRGRSRRSLASPYRPLFDVADNGTMIQGL